MKIKKWFLSLLVIGIVLTGCEQKISVNFPSDQNWTIKTVADFERDFVKGIGETAGDIFGSEFNIDIPGSIFDPKVILPPAMRLLEMGFKEMGMEFDWDYANDKLAYKISGSSFSQLEGTSPPEFFSIESVGNNKYKMIVDYTYFGEEYAMISALAYDTELTISAGRIYSSNADKQTRTKAVWNNPTKIELTFSPGAPINAVPLLIGAGGIGLLAIIIVVLKNRAVKMSNDGGYDYYGGGGSDYGGGGSGDDYGNSGRGGHRGGRGKITCPSCGKKVKGDQGTCPSCGSWL